MSNIEWTDKTWNPVTGCTKISPGCLNCYAEKMSKRLAGRCGYPADEPFRITVHPDKLRQPTKWKKPKRIFVSSMGDLFHDDVPRGIIKSLVGTFMDCPQHTFLLLTKRAKRMNRLSNELQGFGPNVWCGVTVENNDYLRRVGELLQTETVKRFISVEPMLGPVRIDEKILKQLDWVICGCESGNRARQMNNNWAFDLMRQCKSANVPFFLKQLSYTEYQNGKRKTVLVKMPEINGKIYNEIPVV